ncbi:MAG: hypothetical protein Q8L74_13200 [Nitrospirota bacterium]|nr:hypothetical protein [Nitrospirota bacterium]MDP2383144.1 hypothetical protein [Nitrospirota bacterium]MDP3598032.1 hypothetical protein [Nitrospirota bacterium]
MLSFLNNIIICFFVIFQMFSFTLLSLAANLDAPVIEKPTIRSEITRGRQSIRPCERNSALLTQMQSYKDCIDEVLSTAARNGSSTSPFQLGIHFEAFINMAIAYNSLVTVGSATKLQHALTNLQFHQFQDLHKQVGISTEDLCEVTKRNCPNLKELLDTWNGQS